MIDFVFRSPHQIYSLTKLQKDKDDLQEVSQDLEELELEADEYTKVQ